MKKIQLLCQIRQENGRGSAIWLAHLTIMFYAISSVCIGAALAAVEGNWTVTTVGTGYVNDVTLKMIVDESESQDKSVVCRKLK